MLAVCKIFLFFQSQNVCVYGWYVCRWRCRSFLLSHFSAVEILCCTESLFSMEYNFSFIVFQSKCIYPDTIFTIESFTKRCSFRVFFLSFCLNKMKEKNNKDTHININSHWIWHQFQFYYTANFFLNSLSRFFFSIIKCA